MGECRSIESTLSMSSSLTTSHGIGDSSGIKTGTALGLLIGLLPAAGRRVGIVEPARMTLECARRGGPESDVDPFGKAKSIESSSMNVERSDVTLTTRVSARKYLGSVV